MMNTQSIPVQNPNPQPMPVAPAPVEATPMPSVEAQPVQPMPVQNQNPQPMPVTPPVEAAPTPNVETQPVQSMPVQNPNPQPMPVTPPVGPAPMPSVETQPVQPMPVQNPNSQPIINNNFANQPQMNSTYNQGAPIGNANVVPNTPGKKNNKLLIIGGAIAAAVIIIILIIVFAGGKYKKTLSCDLNFNISGVNGTETIKFYINDGEIAITQSRTYNLDKFDSKYYPTSESKDNFAQNHINSGKNDACSGGKCTYSYVYVKNKKLKETVKYSTSQSKEIVGSSAQEYTAQEIYDKLKTNIETTGLSGMPYTCK